jgi:hypothetical protein
MKFSTHLRPFNEHDHAAFQGADTFRDGDGPLIADAIPGAPDALAVAARSGVEVFLGEDLRPFTLAYPVASTGERADWARAFCDGLFGCGPWALSEAELERLGFERA